MDRLRKRTWTRPRSGSDGWQQIGAGKGVQVRCRASQHEMSSLRIVLVVNTVGEVDLQDGRNGSGCS